MRLNERTQQIIRDTTQEVFGPKAVVRVFGSRLDDKARGGDIDLLVSLPEPCPENRARALTLTARLQMRLGDRKIDVLVSDGSRPPGPVHQEALRTGVPL